MSLEYKLPLLITALLLSIVAVGLLFAYLEVQRAAVDSARARLELVSREIAELVEPGVAEQTETLRSVAASAPVVDALRTGAGDDESVQAELQRLAVSNQPDARVVVLDSSGRVVEELGGASIGRGALPTDQLPPRGYGAFFQDGDGVRYWTSFPVGDPGSPVGYVAQLRQVSGTGNPNPVQAILGRDTELVFGNDLPGGPWVTLAGDVVPTPDSWPFLGPGRYQSPGGEYYVHTTPLAGTPWQVIARVPATVVLSRPNAFASRAAIALLVLGFAGAAGAWLLSWRITQPIRQLRLASEAIGHGDYRNRIESTRTDELGMLADAYNRMAERIQSAHRELREQYDTAHALAAELEQASRAKSEFLATMSHEIRTPINAIVGYTDLLLMQVEGPINEAQTAQLERIRISGRHLVGLVDQVLDLARVESGKLDLDPREADLRSSIHTMLTVLRPQADSKRIVVDCDEMDDENSLRYLGDPSRVDQILVNLLSNAIKFTGVGGQVTVRCERRTEPLPVDGRPGSWTCVSISDTGMGIPREQLDRIFGAFVQVESGYTRRHGGAGLGLAISLRLARSMGGDISVVSEVGRGSTFIVWLPAIDGEAARILPAAGGGTGDESPDDEPPLPALA